MSDLLWPRAWGRVHNQMLASGRLLTCKYFTSISNYFWGQFSMGGCLCGDSAATSRSSHDPKDTKRSVDNILPNRLFRKSSNHGVAFLLLSTVSCPRSVSRLSISRARVQKEFRRKMKMIRNEVGWLSFFFIIQVQDTDKCFIETSTGTSLSRYSYCVIL